MQFVQDSKACFNLCKTPRLVAICAPCTDGKFVARL